jgi:hydroxymethylbilane synthase
LKNRCIKIGTRGSKLALIQAKAVKNVLERIFPDLFTDLVIIKTKGDKIIHSPLSRINDKGLFTKNLESALIKKEIDLAVHSLKDLPTELPEDLTLGGVLKRGEVRDVLISNKGRKLAQLTNSDTIGTSSVRRRSLLLSYNRDFRVINIRGNVDTRLRKMGERYCDARILAGAGIIRSGYREKITEYIDPEVIMPSVCQGIIGIENRKDDDFISHVLNQINHTETYLLALAERTFLRTIEGGCQVPCGCITSINEDTFFIKGFISDLDGTTVIKKSSFGPIDTADEIAEELGRLILSAGGREVLECIRGKNG